MTDSTDALAEFAEKFAVRDRDLASLGGVVLHYGLLLRNALDEIHPLIVDQGDVDTPTQTDSGKALSPWHAAACLDDRVRTAAFIRGAIHAVEFAVSRSPGRPVHLLEGGCGPLGALVLPLLAYFSCDELEVSLIDLHQESIDCVEAMLDHFGFRHRVRQLVCTDATEFIAASEVDIVLTETMNCALSGEPQVAISRALLQRHPGALLVPQSIRIDLTLVNIAAERAHFPPQVCDRRQIATVFEFNRDSAVNLPEQNGLLPAASVEMPGSIPLEYYPCLTTTVQVFNETQISDYESQITIPVLLSQLECAVSERTIHFTYRMLNPPGLEWA